ncbi:MAG: LamG domain-containing protein, partial [Candidatus Thorarchaeota archaeon]
TQDRYLINVQADATIVTSGTLHLDRIPLIPPGKTDIIGIDPSTGYLKLPYIAERAVDLSSLSTARVFDGVELLQTPEIFVDKSAFKLRNEIVDYSGRSLVDLVKSSSEIDKDGVIQQGAITPPKTNLPGVSTVSGCLVLTEIETKAPDLSTLSTSRVFDSVELLQTPEIFADKASFKLRDDITDYSGRSITSLVQEGADVSKEGTIKVGAVTPIKTNIPSIDSSSGKLNLDQIGKPGYGRRYVLSFDGTDDFVEVSPDTSLDLTNNLTIIAWVKKTRDAIEPVVDKEDTYALDFHDDKGVCLHYFSGGAVAGGWWGYKSTPLPYTIGEWFQVACVKEGTTIRYYYNGSLHDTISNVAESIDTSTNPLQIARGPTGALEWFAGQYMNIMIYNRALSDEEIKWNYLHPDNPVRDGLVLWLKMDEGEGTKAFDYSGNDNDGTINGATWMYEQAPVGLDHPTKIAPPRLFRTPGICKVTGMLRLPYVAEPASDLKTLSSDRVYDGVQLLQTPEIFADRTTFKLRSEVLDNSGRPITDLVKKSSEISVDGVIQNGVFTPAKTNIAGLSNTTGRLILTEIETRAPDLSSLSTTKNYDAVEILLTPDVFSDKVSYKLRSEVVDYSGRALTDLVKKSAEISTDGVIQPGAVTPSKTNIPSIDPTSGKLNLDQVNKPGVGLRPVLSFDGTDDYAEAPLDMANLIANKAFTVEAWVYWRAKSNWAKVVSTDYHQDGSWSSPWVFFCLSQHGIDGTWEIFTVTCKKTDGTLWYSNADSGVPVETGKWLHVVGRTWIDGTTMYAELWIDGVRKHSYSVTDVENYDPGASDRIFLAVRSSFSKGEWGNCIISLVRIYNRALSEDEIKWNYLHPSNPVRDCLVLWLKMDEDEGTKVYDHSGNDNDGTIY